MNMSVVRKVLRVGSSLILGLLMIAGLLFVMRQTTPAAFADPVPPPEGYPKYNTSVKTVTPTLAATGGVTLFYQIRIRNTGAYTGENTTLTDPIPPGTSYNDDALASIPSTFSFNNGVLSWFGDIDFDTTAVISFSVSVSPTYSGTVRNTATISQALISEPLTVSAETVVTDRPILTLKKTSQPSIPGTNRNITYTISVGNQGQTAVNMPITVTDLVPTNTTLYRVGLDGSASSISDVVTWTRPITLDLGETTYFTFSVQVNEVPSGTVITNDTYSVASPGGGIVSGEPYTVTAVNPKFLIAKGIWPDPPGSNRPLTYTLSLLNQGSLATNVVVTDRVPSGATYLSGGSEVNGIVSWYLPRLDTNEAAEFTFTVFISDIAGIPLINESYGVCSAEGTCQAGEVLTSVVGGPTFQAAVVLDPIAKKPGGGGGPVTPTLTVRNIGPGNASDASATLFFDRISVQAGDLYVVPSIGTPVPFPDGPECGNNCSSYVWTGPITVGTTVTFSTLTGQSTIGGSEGTNYTATIVVSDSLSNMTTEPVTATAIGRITHYAEIIPVKSAPRVIGAGQIMTYTLRVRNGALSTDAPPWLTDTVPLSVTVASVSDGGITMTLGSMTVVSWTLPDMGPGDSLIRRFAVRVDEDLVSGTKIVNDAYRATWYETQISGVLSRTGQSVTTTVKEVGLIDSYKEVTPTLAFPGPGNILTYHLHVVNSGPFSLSDVTAYDTLPWQSTTYQRDAIASAGQVISDIVSLRWIGDLAPFSEEVVTFTVLVDPDFQGAITNTAVISHPDLVENVVVEAVAYITDQPVLKISKTAAPDPVDVGAELLYVIRVSNMGQQASELAIFDTIPVNTTYVPNSASAGGILSGGQIQWQIPVLEAVDSQSFSFRVTVGGGSPFVVNEEYQVTSGEGITATGRPVTTTIDYSSLSAFLPIVFKN